MNTLRRAALAAALISLSSLVPALASDQITLSEAFAKAAAADPSLPAAGARVEAADAGVRQSGARPNPSLGVEVENFAGSGEYKGFDDTETTLSYQQPIELGGKRDARMGLASRERDAAQARALIAQLNLFEKVQLAYSEALAASAAIDLAKERLQVAQSLEKELARRIASARDPEFAGVRAKAQVADAQLALDQARLTADAARQRLASYWQGGANFRLDGKLLNAIVVPTANERSPNGADLAVLEAERSAAAARVEVERSKSYQDPTLSIGVRHFGRNDDVAVVVGGSIPLNIYDDNQGSIDRAAAEQRAASLDLASYRINRDREIARLRSALEVSAEEVSRIDRDILPASQRAVSLVRDGFGRGAFTYLDVIEAQNALSDMRGRRIDALRRFHADKAALDRLLGTHAIITTEVRK